MTKRQTVENPLYKGERIPKSPKRKAPAGYPHKSVAEAEVGIARAKALSNFHTPEWERLEGLQEIERIKNSKAIARLEKQIDNLQNPYWETTNEPCKTWTGTKGEWLAARRAINKAAKAGNKPKKQTPALALLEALSEESVRTSLEARNIPCTPQNVIQEKSRIFDELEQLKKQSKGTDFFQDAALESMADEGILANLELKDLEATPENIEAEKALIFEALESGKVSAYGMARAREIKKEADHLAWVESSADDNDAILRTALFPHEVIKNNGVWRSRASVLELGVLENDKHSPEQMRAEAELSSTADNPETKVDTAPLKDALGTLKPADRQRLLDARKKLPKVIGKDEVERRKREIDRRKSRAYRLRNKVKAKLLTTKNTVTLLVS